MKEKKQRQKRKVKDPIALSNMEYRREQRELECNRLRVATRGMHPRNYYDTFLYNAY